MKQNFLLNDLHYIVFSGGAQKGNAFMGSMSVLQDIHSMCKPKVSLYQQIKGYGGVSIGSLFALGCSLGIPFKKYRQWCVEQDTKDFIDHCEMENILYTKGLLTKELISKYVRNLLLLNTTILKTILQKRNPSKDTPQYSDEFLNSITFLELYQISQKWLRIVGSNLSTQKVIIMDYLNTPFLSVVDACTASMSIPFVFEPSFIPTSICLAADVFSSSPNKLDSNVNNSTTTPTTTVTTTTTSTSNESSFRNSMRTQNKIIKNNCPNTSVNCIVDGGIYNNYPITLFPIKETLGFRLRSMQNQTVLKKDVFGLQEYCVTLLMNTMEYYEDYILNCLPKEYLNHTVTIYLPSCSALEMICASQDLKKQFMMHGELTMFFYLFFDKVLCLVIFIILFLLMFKDSNN